MVTLTKEYPTLSWMIIDALVDSGAAFGEAVKDVKDLPQEEWPSDELLVEAEAQAQLLANYPRCFIELSSGEWHRMRKIGALVPELALALDLLSMNWF